MRAARFNAILFGILILELAGCGDGAGGPAVAPTRSNSGDAPSISNSGERFSRRTRLVRAVMNGDIETVQQLLDQGAKADDGLELAVDAGDLERVDLLLDEGARPDASSVMRGVVAIVLNGRGYEVVELLLARGAKPDWRALFAAVRHNDGLLVQILLEGVNVNATDHFGNTALDLAVKEGLPEIAALLRSLGGARGQGDLSRLN